MATSEEPLKCTWCQNGTLAEYRVFIEKVEEDHGYAMGCCKRHMLFPLSAQRGVVTADRYPRFFRH